MTRYRGILIFSILLALFLPLASIAGEDPALESTRIMKSCLQAFEFNDNFTFLDVIFTSYIAQCFGIGIDSTTIRLNGILISF